MIGIKEYADTLFTHSFQTTSQAKQIYHRHELAKKKGESLRDASKGANRMRRLHLSMRQLDEHVIDTMNGSIEVR